MSRTQPQHVEFLTSRESEMAHAVSRGLRNRQIAAAFGISEETVKKHLATVYDKLDLSGRVALAIYVLQGNSVLNRPPSNPASPMLTLRRGRAHHPIEAGVE
jgi:DNA-binding NarL/FixJ family response regulator